MLCVIDGGISTKLGTKLALRIAGGRRNHIGPFGFGNLYGGAAHPASCAQYEHGVASFDLTPVNQGVVRGGVGHDEGGCIGHGKARG